MILSFQICISHITVVNQLAVSYTIISCWLTALEYMMYKLSYLTLIQVHRIGLIYKGGSISKVTRPHTGEIFPISLECPAKPEQIEHCFATWPLDGATCPSDSSTSLGRWQRLWKHGQTLKCVVRSVIKFLRLQDTSPAEIHCQLIEVYGTNVICQGNRCRTDVKDENRPHSHLWWP